VRTAACHEQLLRRVELHRVEPSGADIQVGREREQGVEHPLAAVDVPDPEVAVGGDAAACGPGDREEPARG
jgi:hypothetical protein